MTKSKNTIDAVKEDPVKASAERLSVARAALKAGEAEVATRRESVVRLNEAAVRGDANDDAAAVAEITAAEKGLQIAEGRIPLLEGTLREAEAEHANLNAHAVLARVSADPALTGETKRRIVSHLAELIAEACATAIADLREVDERRAALSAEARAAGVPFAVDGPNVRVRTNRGVIRPKAGLIPGSGPSSPEAIVRAVRAGTFGPNKVPTVDLIEDVSDGVSAEDADYGREILGQLCGVPVAPLADYDAMDDSGGRWAAIRSMVIDGENVVLEAIVFGSGGDLPHRSRDEAPLRRGAVLLNHATSSADGITTGVSDPRRATGPIDIQAVANAATAAIQAVPAERFDDPLARLLDHEDFTLTAAVFPGDDAHTVAIEWRRWRDGHSVREVLPVDIVREALTGLPIAGAGVVGGVEIGGDGRHILGIRADSAEAETAELAA